MGFLVGKLVSYTLLALPVNGITQKSVNAAFLRIKNFKSDLWCRPWYFGNLKSHVPNNWDRTVTFVNKKIVQKEGCFAIAAGRRGDRAGQGGREEVEAHVRDVLATGSGAVGRTERS